MTLFKEVSFLKYQLGEWCWTDSIGDAVCASELFEDTIHIQTVGRENQETTITQDIKNLIEKGKQQGLKIVVTFE